MSFSLGSLAGPGRSGWTAPAGGYLVFAKLLPDQRDVTAEYQLDPDRLYYREVDGDLFPLPANDSSVPKNDASVKPSGSG